MSQLLVVRAEAIWMVLGLGAPTSILILDPGSEAAGMLVGSGELERSNPALQ